MELSYCLQSGCVEHEVQNRGSDVVSPSGDLTIENKYIKSPKGGFPPQGHVR